jgi:hypothetical protein
MSIIQGTSKASSGSYQIDQSCRFNDNDSAYITQTFAGPGTGTGDTCTYSVWLKRGNLGTSQYFLSVGVGDPYFIGFQANDTLRFTRASGGSPTITTTAVFRDCSAWYHIVLTIDTSLTAVDRWKIYVNNVRQTVTTGGTLAVTPLGTALPHYIGRYVSAASYFDGYMAEINFVDGTALDPSSFGETDDDGVWVPIEYTGAYGTNGFYLDFSNSSDFGSDQSGNANDFTDSGLTTTDQMLDTPTVNYCTWNAVDAGTGTLSDGNLVLTGASDRSGTFGMSSGKWAWKITTAASTAFGVVQESLTGTESTYTATSGEVLEFQFDADAGTLDKSVDGGAYSSVATGLTDGPYFPLAKGACTADFGQSGFTLDDATFRYLNTANLPAPTIKDGSAHFQTTLYTGNGTAIGSGGNAISQSGNSTFQPDFAWIKGRSGATEHVLTDAVRGVTKELSSNDFNAEETVAEGLTTFGSAGFTVGSDGSYNTSSATYVGWQWKANGAGSSNEDGSVSSTVSANTTAGFSIAKATAAGSGVTFSIGHGLGITPSMVICKGLGVSLWSVYHHKISSPNDNYVRLDTTTAVVSDSGVWGTGPTSSVFSAKSGTAMTHSEDFVAYCFAEVDGFSSFGSYTGNGSANGPMVNCGFRPAFVLIKRTNATENWLMMDSTRYPNNPANNPIFADTTNADANGGRPTDFLSNGFKPRNTLAGMNASGSTYIYMAFAEHPFGGANTAPATAR